MSQENVNRDHASLYFEIFRKDVIAAVPPDAKRVLSIGCATGKTEEVLIKKGIEVVGVELNPEAAEIARERGLTILEGDASEVDVNIDGKYYDCIIYADVLEHLLDPVAVLKRHMKSLKHGGIVYITVPNFRHYSVFWQLFVRGRIRYKNAGILDRTHLRITTRKMVEDWLKSTDIEKCSHSFLRYPRDKWLNYISFGLLEEFISFQFSILGRKK